uniref:Fibronectin type-III domain-containing protein n=1 Tax=Timema monikensis TaxID=170555 RepID=A0A7R9EDL5_9NEOP|nr:unnamed protein product [Timema monikensis]
MTVSHWSFVRNQTCVSNFTVCWKKTDGLNETCRENPIYKDIIIKDLGYCTNYTLTTFTSSIDGLSSTNRTLYRSTGSGNVENITLSSGPDWVTVKWDPPTQGQECISHFSIFHKNINAQEGEVDVKADVSEFVLTDLEACTQWYFVIRVLSDEDVYSKMPSPVEDFKVDEVKSHSLHMRWSPPSENNKCLFKYKVCWRKTLELAAKCAIGKLEVYPRHSIHDLESCTDYIVTVSTMGSQTHVGNETSLAVSTGPEPVTALKVDNVDTRSVTVSWESPSCAQQFSVCWGAWQDKGGHSCTSVTKTSYTVPGLEPGNNYTIIVAALGNDGAQSDIRVVTAYIAQENVGNLTVKNYTRNSITVFWGAPFDQKSSQNARVCWKVIGEYSDETCSNSIISDKEYTIDDLEPCHWYKVTVTLKNGEERKFESVEQFTAASNTEPPEEVKEISIASLTYDSFRVKWDKSNESCASHFLVCWEQSQGKDNGCQLIPSYETDFYKGDLKVCANVTVSVSALSVDGLSSGNDSITITTGPGVVRNVTSWIVELGSVGVRWEPPLPGEDCVSYYKVGTLGRYFENLINVTGDKLEYVWTNLTHCEHKGFLILAVNSQHAFSNTALKFSTSGTGAPGEVTEPEVTQTGSHSLHLEWKPPLELFDCLLRYFVCWKETNGTDSACAEQKLEEYPKRTLYGLKSCTEYTITLAALGVDKLHDNDTTLTQFTGPEPVTALKVDNVDTRSVTVSWESPSCAQQFSVCWGAWQDKGGHSCTSVTNTSYTVPGLEPGNNYTIIVAALGLNEAQSDLNIATVQLPPAAAVSSSHYAAGSIQDSVTSALVMKCFG